MKKMIFGLAAATLAAVLCGGPAGAASVSKGVEVKIPLETVTFKNGKQMNLTIGVGSGAYHVKSDPAGVIYLVTDRGPNIDCKDAEKLIGADLCPSGKIFPSPAFIPSIYKINADFDNGSYELLEVLTIKGKDGLPITGLPNPFTVTDTEKAYSVDGVEIPFDASGLDVEAVVRMSDGSFWLAEEYAPSLVHVAADGRVIKRLVPVSVGVDLKDASYDVVELFPVVFKKRQLNRGMESVAVSPDEKYLYTAMQSPLANPDAAAYKGSKNVRILKINLADLSLAGEYVYVMDAPETYKLDGSKKQTDVKVSEMRALGDDKLMVLERISKSTKFYEVDLKAASNILGTKWDDEAASPSLAQVKDLSVENITPVSKNLLLDTSDGEGMPRKIEGIALIDEKTMVLVNDNDFGIEGDDSYLYKVTMD